MSARGERHGRARLTDAQARMVKKLLRRGVTHAVIAARYGVTRSNVTQIATGRSWAWLQI